MWNEQLKSGLSGRCVVTTVVITDLKSKKSEVNYDECYDTVFSGTSDLWAGKETVTSLNISLVLIDQ